MVLPFRRARGDQRQQLKLFTYAAALVAVMLFAGDFVPVIQGAFDPTAPDRRGNRRPQVPPLRHRPPDQPHPRLRPSHRSAGGGLRRRRASVWAASFDDPSTRRATVWWSPAPREAVAASSGLLEFASRTSSIGASTDVDTTRADHRRVLVAAARSGRSRCLERGSARGGEQDAAVGSRLAVAQGAASGPGVKSHA
jgi:hypothetical protein